MQPVFITGGTGYIGKRIIPLLQLQGCAVTALIRKQSIHKLAGGCTPVLADPFNAASYANHIAPGSTFIHLLGVSHPGPQKKSLFYSVDLAAAKASAVAAKQAGVIHFIYMSVAQYPSTIMESYQHARTGAEAAILATGIKTTVIRPWYIVGPGHYWPLLLEPVFALLRHIPATAVKANALAPVSLDKMLLVLQDAVKYPPEESLRIIEVAEIKKQGA